MVSGFSTVEEHTPLNQEVLGLFFFFYLFLTSGVTLIWALKKVHLLLCAVKAIKVMPSCAA